jgi:hypothetical protein
VRRSANCNEIKPEFELDVVGIECACDVEDVLLAGAGVDDVDEGIAARRGQRRRHEL